MDVRFNCFWCVAPLTAGILALTSCSQLPSHISVVNKVSLDNTSASFDQCAMSVRFSGRPHPLTSNEMSQFELWGMTKFAKWEVDGLSYERYRLTEYATCICRDHEFTDNEVYWAEERARTKKDSFIRAHNPPGSRKALEFEAAVSDGIKLRMQQFFPIATPKCMFLHIATYDESTSSAATAFLGSYQSAQHRSPEVSDSVVVKPKPSMADRLQELSDLRRRELITEKEYELKRKAILEEIQYP